VGPQSHFIVAENSETLNSVDTARRISVSVLLA